ncbi:MAG: hypothetical protein ACLT8E_11265 [Akkermansia sp.]
MGERQVTYVWAVIVGVVGASMSCFWWTVEVIQWLLGHLVGSRVGTFSQVELSGACLFRWWAAWRPVHPAVPEKRMRDEPRNTWRHVHRKQADQIRASALKVFSTAWSIASGAAIGKEGPIISPPP